MPCLLIGMLVWHLSRRSTASDSLDFNFYNDHYRHMRFAWEALRIGPRIYSVPLGAMAAIGEPRAYSWMESPYLYPPGAILIFLPWAVLSYEGLISSRSAGYGLVFLFGTAAVVGGIRLWRCGVSRTSSSEGVVLWAVFACSFLLHAIGWSLCAQYDAIVILVLVVAASARTPSRRVLWLGIALALKFQALLFLPFVARETFLLVRSKRGAVVRDAPAMVGAALVALVLVNLAYLEARGALAPQHANPFHLAQWTSHRLTLLCIVFTMSLALLAFVKGRWGASFVMLWGFLAFASVALLQGWYILYLYPLALFVDRRAAPWVVAWSLGLIYFLGWIPNFSRVMDQLLVLSS